MSGWYRMHRGWMKSPDFKREPFTEREAFVWSIEKAAFDPHEQWFNGRRVALRPGQLITSLRAMADEFGWPLKRVRCFLQRMLKAQKWAHLGAHGGTIITVCNYSEYQTLENSKGTMNGRLGAHEGHTKGTQDKKEKKAKKEDKSNDLFVDLDNPPLTAAEVLDAWNETAEAHGLPKAVKLTETRKRQLDRRIRENPMEDWQKVFAAVGRSSFLKGNNPTGWRADFDFILQPKSFTKLLEGSYDH